MEGDFLEMTWNLDESMPLVKWFPHSYTLVAFKNYFPLVWDFGINTDDLFQNIYLPKSF